MVRHLLVAAGRALWRHPLHLVIGLLCLTLGLAGCFLIGHYVSYAVSYDDHWPDSDRIVRLVSSQQTSDDDWRELAMAPLVWGPALEAEHPAVQDMVRIDPFSEWVSYGDDAVRKGRGENRDDGTHLSGSRVKADLLYADRSVLDVFGLDLLQGNPETVLTTDYDLLLTEDFAREHFGTENPIGERFKLSSRIDGFEVVGIVENIPPNSHFSADIILPHSSWMLRNRVDWTSVRSVYTYLVMESSDSRAEIAKDLPAFLQAHGPDEVAETFTASLQPVSSIHLHSDRAGEIQAGGNERTVLLMVGIAGIILLLGCINFANLATARAADRQREIGVRKAVGAQRWQLAQQFLVEAGLVSAGAVAAATGVSAFLLPTLNAYLGTSLAPFGGLSVPGYLAVGVGTVAALTLLAGGYPAFGLSRFAPRKALAGRVCDRASDTLRSGLVIGQFTVAVVLVIGTGIMYQQVRHMTSLDPGFSKENIVVLPVSGHGQNTNFDRTILAFRSAPGISNVATISRRPGDPPRIRAFQRSATGKTTELSLLFTDDRLAETLDLSLVAGSWLSERVTTSKPSVVLNEAAVRQLGYETPRQAVGDLIHRMEPSSASQVDVSGRIVGVVANFHWSSVQAKQKPMAMMPGDSKYELGQWLVQVVPGASSANVLDHLRTTWKELAFYPEMYRYSFLSADWSALYQGERQLQRMVALFAALGVLIACLGLFGLATYTARRRTKEIGIRKAVGATKTHIVVLLSKDFLRQVGLACLLATPVAYLLVQAWLRQFADAVQPSAWVFATAITGALAVAVATVSLQALRAARLDPTETLRTE